MSFNQLNRREFVSVFGGTAVWPVVAEAQQLEPTRRIGVLMGLPEGDPEVKTWLAAFLDGLHEAGWIERRNAKIEYQWSDTVSSIGPDAARLVKAAPDVILARGSSTLDALRRETNTLPIVFVGVSDPVGQGVVTSLAHPGGNITGFANHEHTIPTKFGAIERPRAKAVPRSANP
jgi:putative ABC transport system substrate-binding protein